MSTIIFLFSVAIYYVIHSLLAAKAVKERLYLIISKRVYRIFFNLISIALLIPLIWMYFNISHESIFVKTSITKFIGWVILAIGLFANVMAIRQYNLAEFSGVAYLSNSETQHSSKLNISGLNKWIRHPLYTTTLLVMLGVVVLEANVAMLGIALLSLIYILIGIQLEERKLIVVFGADYVQYKKDVRMLVPFLF